MWLVLDQEFGRPEQLVNEVTDRLKKLSAVNDGDPNGLMTFVDTLRSGMTDLKLIGAQSAMSNPMTLREIESKMPEQLAIKWSDIVRDSGDTIHFDNKLSYAVIMK